MNGRHRIIWKLGLYLMAGICGRAQVLWSEPSPATVSNWTWGPGGEEMAPRPPFEFVKEKLSGTSPKVEVSDAAGRVWTVKFGSEVHADVFAARLVTALGYAAQPSYYVPSGTIRGVRNLKRGKYFVSKNGSFRSARFKLKEHHPDAQDENDTWSWVDNPYTGTRELSGLKILMMLTSNWDAKDSRDGKSSNNEVIQPTPDSPLWYAVTDWGASFGKSGGFFRRDRWDWNGYRAENSDFIRVAPNGALQWGFEGKHAQDITAGVTVEDVRWLLPYLSRITDQDLEAGMIASGASTAVACVYTQSIRARIEQLQRVAQSQKLHRVGESYLRHSVDSTPKTRAKSLSVGFLRGAALSAFMGHFLQKIGRFSVSDHAAWAVSETQMVAPESQALRPRTLRFSV